MNYVEERRRKAIDQLNRIFKSLFDAIGRLVRDMAELTNTRLVIGNYNNKFWKFKVVTKKLSTRHSRATALNAFTRRSRHSEL